MTYRNIGLFLLGFERLNFRVYFLSKVKWGKVVDLELILGVKWEKVVEKYRVVGDSGYGEC